MKNVKVGDLAYNRFFDEIYLIVANRNGQWECLNGNGELEYMFDCLMNNKNFEAISENWHIG